MSCFDHMGSHWHPAWRLSLLWHDAVLDTVTVAGQRTQSITFSTGDTFTISFVEGANVDDGVAVQGILVRAVLLAGQRLELPAGHVLCAEPEPQPAPAARGRFFVDSTLLHSVMIAFAAVTCVVSAFWLAPVGLSSDPGGGIASDARRWLSLPGGSARVVARATFSAAGRPTELGERYDLRQLAGSSSAHPAGPRPSLERTLEAMKQALQRGAEGDAQRDPVGELARQVAAAPVLGAGVGGLSPRDPADLGAGSGIIGAGDALRQQAILRRAVAEVDRSLPARTNYPVALVDVPDAAVDDDGGLASRPELDPIVRDHLTRMIRTRHNVIRACYEAWGLAADARQGGRLILELTLRPDGRVEELSTMTSTPQLSRVGSCVERAALEWYLGDGLVDAPTRLAFPFNLQPRH